MDEEGVRSYLTKRQTESSQKGGLAASRPVRNSPQRRRPAEPEGYGDFSATHMACPKCRTAMPVKQRLMLYLPDGALFGYYCETCGSSCGTRKA